MKSTSMYDDPRGFVCKLGDFGLSRVLEHNSTHVSTNTYGTSPGPIQALQERCVQKGVQRRQKLAFGRSGPG